MTRSMLHWGVLVALHDGEASTAATVRSDDSVVGMRVSRSQVARVAAGVLDDDATLGKVLSVSSA